MNVTTTPPSVSITASANNICSNSPVTFQTNTLNAGSSPVYIWKLNNKVVANSNSYTSSTLVDGDNITCIVISDASCSKGLTDTSNTIKMNVKPLMTPAISIQNSKNNICPGTNVDFNAIPINGGPSPSYQWQINGTNVGINSPNYISAKLADRDIIDCILTSNAPCASPISSVNKIRMTVTPLPVITMEPDKLIRLGSSISLNPSVSGNIASYTWSPSKMLNDSRVKNPVATLSINTTFGLKVLSVEGCKADASITITVFTDLLMPTAFTPNKDGKNDIYGIPPSMLFGINYFAIYNRWETLYLKLQTDQLAGMAPT